jgi:hypothetical protein
MNHDQFHKIDKLRKQGFDLEFLVRDVKKTSTIALADHDGNMIKMNAKLLDLVRTTIVNALKVQHKELLKEFKSVNIKNLKL